MFPAQVLEMVVAHPDPAWLRLLQLLNTAMAVRMAYSERKGEGVRYSKFASGALQGRTVSSKRGMAILYTPAAVACSSFLLSKLAFPLPPASSHPLVAFFSRSDHRLVVFAAALSVHFLKRLFEVFFVHQYSGSMEMSVSFTIAIFYLYMSVILLYVQQLSLYLHPPALDLMGVGVCVYLVGIAGNFYHHYLLARLRSNKKSKGQYLTPQGGLFTWVVCPHYLFECITFLGIALIGQTSYAFVNALCIFISLGARSQSTKLWYQKKIENFPSERKAFLPFLF